MWKPKSIQLVNFGTYKDSIFEFRQGKAILVVGRNLDNEGQKGNGSGKSFINEAISVCITGGSIRKCKTRELVRNGEDFSELTFVMENVYTGGKMRIVRKLFKKESQSATCQIWENGSDKPIETCSDINAYNAYILNQIGISEDDFFNFFLVTKELFKPFLSTGDTEKKQIINRFSGANVVDKVDEFIKKDSDEKDVELKKLNDELIRNETKKSLTQERIDKLKEETSDEIKQKKIQELVDKIKLKREEVFEIEKKLLSNDKRTEELKVEQKTLLTQNPNTEAKIKLLKEEIEAILLKIESIKKQSKDVVNEFKAEIDEVRETEDVCNTEIKTSTETYNTQLKKLKETKAKDTKEKEELENKIAGAITCPKCSHEFTLRYGDFNVDNAKKAVEEFKKSILLLETEISTLEIKHKKDIEELEDILKDLKTQKEDINNRITQRREKFSVEFEQENQKLTTTRTTITEYEEKEREWNKKLKVIEDNLSTIKNEEIRGKNEISTIYTSIQVIESQITQLQAPQETVMEVLGLEKELINLQTLIDDGKFYIEQKTLEKRKIEEWFVNFKNFKSYLANQSIKNIEDYTNLFLHSIESNITITIEGYRMLSGGKKLKEEITTTVYKDGFEEGSYGKFSAGERGRIIISNILGLQELINLNAGVGKGLDLLICDEILDSIDTLGLELLINALQNLQKTIMIISQNEINSLSSSTLIIQKKSKVSTILPNE